jgi:hypothetical protein
MCPSSPGYIRNYSQEAKYESTPEQKKRRASRGRARYSLMKKGKVKVGDGKDVAHRNDNPNNNSPSNLAVQSKAKNRSYARTKLGAIKK